jgi:hypothetical protein
LCRFDISSSNSRETSSRERLLRRDHALYPRHVREQRNLPEDASLLHLVHHPGLAPWDLPHHLHRAVHQDEHRRALLALDHDGLALLGRPQREPLEQLYHQLARQLGERLRQPAGHLHVDARRRLCRRRHLAQPLLLDQRGHGGRQPRVPLLLLLAPLRELRQRLLRLPVVRVELQDQLAHRDGLEQLARHRVPPRQPLVRGDRVLDAAHPREHLGHLAAGDEILRVDRHRLLELLQRGWQLPLRQERRGAVLVLTPQVHLRGLPPLDTPRAAVVPCRPWPTSTSCRESNPTPRSSR